MKRSSDDWQAQRSLREGGSEGGRDGRESRNSRDGRDSSSRNGDRDRNSSNNGNNNNSTINSSGGAANSRPNSRTTESASALLRGGVDGPTGLQRRSFDSAFGDSMSLLAGMSSLGLDQTVVAPRQPRISEGSNFWMGGTAGGGGIAFGAGAQTANNAAALQMLLNGHGASIPRVW